VIGSVADGRGEVDVLWHATSSSSARQATTGGATRIGGMIGGARCAALRLYAPMTRMSVTVLSSAAASVHLKVIV
jgi:hypothetical protein